jgi:hypothetical protein
MDEKTRVFLLISREYIQILFPYMSLWRAAPANYFTGALRKQQERDQSYGGR